MSPPPVRTYGGALETVSTWRADGRRALLVTLLAAGAAACADPRAGALRDTRAAYDRLAARRAWPGFEAAAVPLAVTDGERTYLLRHPSPPPEFRPLRGGDGVLVLDSVHPAMRANTAVDLGGATTATVLADSGAAASPAALARTLIHEAFHVFQGVRHPGWAANEVDLFVYPFARVRGLQLRRLETGALRRALLAPDSVRELCWAEAFLRLRGERHRLLPAEAAAWERGAELNEGLARYVEAYAAEDEAPQLPADGFAPDRVRDRAYATGHAIAVLLDRFDPGWKARLEGGEDASLEAALAHVLDPIEVRRCGPSPDETRRALTVARADSVDLDRRNARDRAAFEEAPGWRLVIEATRAPLFPDAFDPQNIRVLGGGAVLHGRWIRLGGAAGRVEVLGRPVLTQAAGAHPLFEGVRRLLVTGLRREPAVERAGDSIRIAADGVEATLRGASVEREGREVRIRLSG